IAISTKRNRPQPSRSSPSAGAGSLGTSSRTMVTSQKAAAPMTAVRISGTRLPLLALALLMLGACSNDMDALRTQVAEIKSRPGERIEPLPEIKPYEAFTYNAANLRSPFVPGAPARSEMAAGVRPDVKRPREFLE